MIMMVFLEDHTWLKKTYNIIIFLHLRHHCLVLATAMQCKGIQCLQKIEILTPSSNVKWVWWKRFLFTMISSMILSLFHVPASQLQCRPCYRSGKKRKVSSDDSLIDENLGMIAEKSKKFHNLSQERYNLRIQRSLILLQLSSLLFKMK